MELAKLLPLNLLRARVSHGAVRPLFARPDDEQNLELAHTLTTAYQTNVGGRRAVLERVLQRLEGGAYDHRLVRGMSTLLERRSTFAAVSPVDPAFARRVVFEEASSRGIVGPEEREEVMEDVAAHLKMSSEDLERALWADVDEEQVLKDYRPIDPTQLVRYYNFSLVQTLLSKSLRLEFTFSGNWQRIFHSIKRLGLMYTVETQADGYKLIVDGPLSLYKMTEQYGSSLAKLLSEIVQAGDWTVRAEVLGRNRDRVYNFELSGGNAKEVMSDAQTLDDIASPMMYDSILEERFAQNFEACNTGWNLQREPEPIINGQHVIVPDFSFQKYGAKVYLEIIGHWTQDYLERRLRKLSMLRDVDIMVAVNKDLSCSLLQESLHGKNVFYYSKNVPLKPILDHLNRLEEDAVNGQVEALIQKGIHLQGDIVAVDELAAYYNVSPESVKRILQGHYPVGYRKLGDYYVSMQRAEDLTDEIGRLGDASVTTALEAIENVGLKHPEKVLEDLGFSIIWNGLDYQNTRVRAKDESSWRTTAS